MSLVFIDKKSEINNLDSLIKQNALLNEESVIVRDSFRVENISNEILFDAATRYGAEMTHPFRAENFDFTITSQPDKTDKYQTDAD